MPGSVSSVLGALALSIVPALSGARGSRRAHHVEHAGREAEQCEHEHSPRQNPEPAIDQPAETRTDQDACDELGREPETAGERRRIGGRSGRETCFGCPAGTDLVQPFAETLEPRGEGSFLGWLSTLIAAPACVVGHRPHPRSRGKSERYRPPKPRGP